MSNFSIGHWVVVIGIGWLLFKMFGGRTKPVPKARTHRIPVTAAEPAHHWKPSREFKDDFEVEVVGESRYDSNIRAAAGHVGNGQVSVTKTALLVPEDSNPHDNKAIAVLIEGHQVGYLSRDDARAFRRRLSARKLTGRTTSCEASIEYGGVSKGKTLNYSVRLAMTPFYED